MGFFFQVKNAWHPFKFPNGPPPETDDPTTTTLTEVRIYSTPSKTKITKNLKQESVKQIS